MTALFAGMTTGTLIVVAFLSLLFYFLPAFVAWKRQHSQLVPIILLNIFLGWSFIGWVIALVWAFMSPSASKASGTASGNAASGGEAS